MPPALQLEEEDQGRQNTNKDAIRKYNHISWFIDVQIPPPPRPLVAVVPPVARRLDAHIPELQEAGI